MIIFFMAAFMLGILLGVLIISLSSLAQESDDARVWSGLGTKLPLIPDNYLVSPAERPETTERLVKLVFLGQ